MTNYEILTLAISALGATFVGVSVIFLAKQLRLVVTAHADNHDWNRRIATEQALSKVRELKGTGTLNEKFGYLNHDSPMALNEILTIFDNDSELQPALHNLLNLYEGLAGGVFLGTYDSATIKANRKTIMESMLVRFRLYIEHRRDGPNKRAWANLERLVTTWRDEEIRSHDREQTGKI